MNVLSVKISANCERELETWRQVMDHSVRAYPLDSYLSRQDAAGNPLIPRIPVHH